MFSGTELWWTGQTSKCLRRSVRELRDFVRKKYTLLERKSCISGTEGRRDSGPRLACSAGPNYAGRVKLPSVSDVRFGSYETLYFLERKSCISGTEGRRDSGPRLACSAGPNYGGRVKLPSVSDVRFGSYETFVRKKYTLLEIYFVRKKELYLGNGRS